MSRYVPRKHKGVPSDLQRYFLTKPKNSGTHVYFLEHVVRKGNAKGKEEYAPQVQLLVSSKAISDGVAGNPNAIGYFGLGWLRPKIHKAVAVGKTAAGPYVEPSVKAAMSGDYPISRKLYLYTNGEPDGDVKLFVDFALSPEGQKIVEKQGFVTIYKNE